MTLQRQRCKSCGFAEDNPHVEPDPLKASPARSAVLRCLPPPPPGHARLLPARGFTNTVWAASRHASPANHCLQCGWCGALYEAACDAEAAAPPAGDGSAPPAPPLLRELWDTRAWRLFPLLLIYMSGAAARGCGGTRCWGTVPLLVRAAACAAARGAPAPPSSLLGPPPPPPRRQA